MTRLPDSLPGLHPGVRTQKSRVPEVTEQQSHWQPGQLLFPVVRLILDLGVTAPQSLSPPLLLPTLVSVWWLKSRRLSVLPVAGGLASPISVRLYSRLIRKNASDGISQECCPYEESVMRSPAVTTLRTRQKILSEA